MKILPMKVRNSIRKEGQPVEKKNNKEIKGKINFTEGWEDRVARATYNLYLRIEAKGKEESA